VRSFVRERLHQHRRCAFLLGMALGTGACSHALPTPPTGPHLHEDPVQVPYPPPAARVDLIQLPPVEMKHAVWIDGQWMWRGRRWVWEPGQWVDLGPNQYYARPTVSWLSDGRLVWFAGSLRSAETALPAPSATVDATATPAASGASMTPATPEKAQASPAESSATKGPTSPPTSSGLGAP